MSNPVRASVDYHIQALIEAVDRSDWKAAKLMAYYLEMLFTAILVEEDRKRTQMKGQQ